MSFSKVLAGTLIAGMLMPALAFAQTTSSSSSIQALLDQIKALQTQIIALQQQQRQTFSSLVSTLQQGSTGDQVTALQILLAQDPSIFPEGKVTGFFGKLTAQAVKRFQKKFGIEQAGNVGPKTLKKLNEVFGHIGTTTNRGDDDIAGDDDHGPCKVPPGHLIAPGFLKNFGPNGKKEFKGRDHSTLRPCVNGGTGTTTPPTVDTTAPILSGITATNITTTGATILWTTNENATSQVEYGTTVSYGATTTLDSTLLMSHSVALSSLSNSTTYHFRVISKDSSGNTATSGDSTFTTVTPDTTAPVISAVSVSPIASTTATVSWTTNEAATSKVYFGTTNPVDLSSALSFSNVSLVTSHSLGLTGLTASTTYFFVVESKDASNNTATTSSASFSTTN